jgi:ADP-ribose pyrophosphatase
VQQLLEAERRDRHVHALFDLERELACGHLVGPGADGEEPLAAAQRELEEEVGLHGGNWRLAATFFSTPGFCDERVWVYLAEGAEDGDADPDENEEIDIVRIPVAELDEHLEDIEDAKTLAGLLLYLRER